MISRCSPAAWAAAFLLLALMPSTAVAAPEHNAPQSRTDARPQGPLRHAHPLRVRNLSPAAGLVGLPRPLGPIAPAHNTELSLIVEHANNFTAASNQQAVAFFDGTTTVTSVSLRRSVSNRFEWGLEVPYVQHSGGFTDAFIDGFHDLFGFPDGGRDAVPRNRMDYRLSYAGREIASVDGRTARLGDARGWVGWRMATGAGRHGTLRLQVKAPTGHLDSLTGSEGADVSFWLEWSDARLLEDLNLTLTAMGGVTVIDEGALADVGPEDVVLSGHLGLHYPLSPRLALRAQLDGHSEVIDTGLAQFAGGALQGTLGGTLSFSPSLWLDLGVSEDLTGKSAPDVVFLLTLGARL